MVSTEVGWVAVCVGTTFWGLFGVPMKMESVQHARLHPVVFQCYMSISIFLSSLLAMTAGDIVWTWWGFASGVLWVTGNLCAINAVNILGLAAAQGFWAGIICVVSFLWGFFAQKLWEDYSCELEDTGLAVGGIVVLLFGIVGVAYFSSPDKTTSALAKVRPVASPTMPVSSLARGDVEALPESEGLVHVNPASPHQELGTPSATHRSRGVLSAAACGLLAGTVLVPSKLAPSHAQGFAFIPSFGTGILVTSYAYLFLARMFFVSEYQLRFHFRLAGWPCLLSGVLWNVGNVASVIATQSPLGLTIAYPLMQNAMVIAGLAGIFVFKEIEGAKRISSFLACVLVVSAGAFLLGRYGACKTHP